MTDQSTPRAPLSHAERSVLRAYAERMLDLGDFWSRNNTLGLRETLEGAARVAEVPEPMRDAAMALASEAYRDAGSYAAAAAAHRTETKRLDRQYARDRKVRAKLLANGAHGPCAKGIAGVRADAAEAEADEPETTERQAADLRARADRLRRVAASL